MDRKATYDDVNLILKLYDMRREDRLRQARAWFASSFKVKTVEDLNAICPPGSEANASYRMVVTYWEMVASFINSGVLNQALFFESGRELLFVWERMRDVVPELRRVTKDDAAYRNLEIAAGSYITWMNARAPEAYAAFSVRVRG